HARPRHARDRGLEPGLGREAPGDRPGPPPAVLRGALVPAGDHAEDPAADLEVHGRQVRGGRDDGEPVPQGAEPVTEPNEHQMERLIDVLARIHLEVHQANVYLRENVEKWIVWLSSRGNG